LPYNLLTANNVIGSNLSSIYMPKYFSNTLVFEWIRKKKYFLMHAMLGCNMTLFMFWDIVRWGIFFLSVLIKTNKCHAIFCLNVFLNLWTNLLKFQTLLMHSQEKITQILNNVEDFGNRSQEWLMNIKKFFFNNTH
jgi:hypothetical protein